MYLKWHEQTITDFSDKNITSLYNEGYVFTRVSKGAMNQTRSLRIDLSKFELSSENRRVLKKTEELQLEASSLPYSNYNWQIGKMAKDFYETKFGKGIFSANKIKELLTNKEKSNFNLLLVYTTLSFRPGFAERLRQGEPERSVVEESLKVNTKRDLSTSPTASLEMTTGYAICRETDELLHYSYPFYNLEQTSKDTGLGMMIRAIVWAKDHGKKYIYLGSASRHTDTYKLQFKGVEWFDENMWSDDLEKLKNIL